MTAKPGDVVVTIVADTTAIDAALDRLAARLEEITTAAAAVGIRIDAEANVEKRGTDEAT